MVHASGGGTAGRFGSAVELLAIVVVDERVRMIEVLIDVQ